MGEVRDHAALLFRLEIVTESQQRAMSLEINSVERAHAIVRVACDLSTPSGRHPSLFRKSRIEGRADKQGIAGEPVQTESIEAAHIARFGSDQNAWPDLCREGGGKAKLGGLLPIAGHP